MSHKNRADNQYIGKVATSAQMRKFDRRAVEEFGIPSLTLMENAGRRVAETAASEFGPLTGKRVTILAGRGNNGGDGFVVARYLKDSGAKIRVFLLAAKDDVKGDARVNLDKLDLPVEANPAMNEIRAALVDSDLVIDAILGTGIRDDVRGLAADVIEAMNNSVCKVLAVDLPSGLDTDNGRICGVCVRADCTVTFALPKIGLYTYPGASCVGKMIVGDIGIPPALYEEVNVEVIGDEWVSARLPDRSADSHKGTFGTALVIAGSSGFIGAAALASEAVLRIGAGLSVAAVPGGLQDVLAVKVTEVMTRPLPETEMRAVSHAALNPALELSAKADAVVIGCGLGAWPDTGRFVRKFLRLVDKPTVVDADALNCLSDDPTPLEGKHADMALTPHPGEMARLLGTNIEQIQSDRVGAVRKAASRFGSVVVLKGAHTLIAEPSGRVFINVTGNSGMATGGTGDVLAGAIGGLLAQGLSPLDAAVCGTYIHGMAGDIAASKLGEPGMIAGDVLRYLPKALKSLTL